MYLAIFENKIQFFKKLTSKITSFLTWHMIKRPKGVRPVISGSVEICADEIVQYKITICIYRHCFTDHQQYRQCKSEHFAREEGKSNYTFKKA